MRKKLSMTVGAAARIARHNAGLTQAEVARQIPMAKEVYGRLERGAMLPSVHTLSRLCAVLSVSADLLLGLPTLVVDSVVVDHRLPEESPEVRKMLRRLQQLLPRQMRVVGLLVTELGRTPPYPGKTRPRREPRSAS